MDFIFRAAEIAETRSTKTSRRSSPRNIHTSVVLANPEDISKSSEYFNPSSTLNNGSSDLSGYSASRPNENGSNNDVITVQEKPSGSPLLTKSKSKGNRSRDVRSANSSPRPGGGGATIEKRLKNETDNPLPSTIANNSNSKKKNDEDADLMEFLNDPNRKELDENLVLQTELANQAREVERLYKTNKQLQSGKSVFYVVFEGDILHLSF